MGALFYPYPVPVSEFRMYVRIQLPQQMTEGAGRVVAQDGRMLLLQQTVELRG